MLLMRLVVVVCFTTLCSAQPVIVPDGVLNSASYLPNCTANGGVAQGSIFVLFGSNLGPQDLRQVTAFPLETTLAGTSIRVTVAGTSVDALPIYTSAGQVAALLRSETPLGNGTITVTYAGVTSAPAPIRVVRSAFGIYTLNQGGTGPAVAQNVEGANITINTPDAAARPGQLMILWGTGLGPTPGDESAGPLASSPPGMAVTVWLGNERARMIYAGRSGCCAGLDQLVFEVPTGVEGCHVPLAVEAGGVFSNFGSIAIAGGSGRCSDNGPVTKVELSKSRGGLLFADVDVQSPFLSFRGQLVQVNFERVPESGPVAGQLTSLTDLFLGGPAAPAGTCLILPPANRDVASLFGNTAIPVAPLDAGVLTFTAESESRRVPQISPGVYGLTIEREFLPQGRYEFSNGSGGSDIGSFSVTGEATTAKLSSAPNRIARDQALMLTWTAADNDTGLVAIVGSSSSNACGVKSVAFVCYERASARQFVVPQRIVGQLPPSTSGGLFGSTGTLTLTGVNENTKRTFTAPGLDLGYSLFLNLQYRIVPYQ